MKIAVMGCGPAGLLAAHAANICGHSVEIYSRKERSVIHGAQYIHEPIPGLCEGDPTAVSYAKLGDRYGYAEKVYLDARHPTSWDTFPVGEVPAWPMQGVYTMLWQKYESLIKHCDINSQSMREFMESDLYDLVFCSLPRIALCEHREHGSDELAHEFKSARVVFEPISYVAANNVVLYSGRTSEDWYRTSRLFGHSSTEYSASLFIGAEIPKRWYTGMKPTTTDCTCLDEYDKLVRIGRFGRWSKAVLVTDAFADVMAALPNDDPWASVENLIPAEHGEDRD